MGRAASKCPIRTTPKAVAEWTPVLASNAAHLARLLKASRYPGRKADRRGGLSVTGDPGAGHGGNSFQTDAETIASKVDSRRTRRVGTLPLRSSYHVKSNLEDVR